MVQLVHVRIDDVVPRQGNLFFVEAYHEPCDVFIIFPWLFLALLEIVTCLHIKLASVAFKMLEVVSEGLSSIYDEGFFDLRVELFVKGISIFFTVSFAETLWAQWAPPSSLRLL